MGRFIPIYEAALRAAVLLRNSRLVWDIIITSLISDFLFSLILTPDF